MPKVVPVRWLAPECFAVEKIDERDPTKTIKTDPRKMTDTQSNFFSIALVVMECGERMEGETKGPYPWWPSSEGMKKTRLFKQLYIKSPETIREMDEYDIYRKPETMNEHSYRYLIKILQPLGRRPVGVSLKETIKNLSTSVETLYT